MQEKGRWSLAPPTQVTSPRNAVRFKGFDVSDSRSQRWSVGIALDVIGGQVPPQARMAQELLESPVGYTSKAMGQFWQLRKWFALLYGESTTEQENQRSTSKNGAQ